MTKAELLSGTRQISPPRDPAAVPPLAVTVARACELSGFGQRRFGPSSRMAGLLRCACQVSAARSFHTRAYGGSLKERARDNDRSAVAGVPVRTMRGPR
jgi:hypothetical protein